MFSAASPSPDPTLDHRVGTTHLRLTDRVGTPLGHTEVEVAQTGHAFGFGCIGFEFVPLAAGEDAEFDSPEGTGLSRRNSRPWPASGSTCSTSPRCRSTG